MRHYSELSKRYFLSIEGVGEPSRWKNWRYWIWLLIFLGWMYSFYVIFTPKPLRLSGGELLFMVLMEGSWIVMTSVVMKWRVATIIKRVNAEFGTAYTTHNECREKYLHHLTGRNPGEYLLLAKEVSDLNRIRKEFQKRIEFSIAYILESIYNKDARPRLMTLFVACLSMMVALTVKTDASLETLFDAFSDSAWRDLMILVITTTGLLFMAAVALRSIAPAGIEILSYWLVLLFEGAVFEELQITYLIRDLIYFYEPKDERIADDQNEKVVI